MSTHAVIARAGSIPGAWAGRYHHSDGYPHGLGKRLYDVARDLGIERMLALLIDEHTAGWSHIFDCDMRKPSGYREWTSAYLAMSIQEQRAFDLTFGPRCYCHGERVWEETLITSDGDDCGAEWAYAIAPDGLMMVYRRDYDPSRWTLAATVNLLGDGPECPEPDWLAMEGERDGGWPPEETPVETLAPILAPDPVKMAKAARRLARLQAADNRRVIDLYRYTREREWQELSAWRLESQFGHADAAAEHLATYQRVKAEYDALNVIINARDLWRTLNRRERQIARQQRDLPVMRPPDAA